MRFKLSQILREKTLSQIYSKTGLRNVAEGNQGFLIVFELLFDGT